MTDKPEKYRPSNGTEGEIFMGFFCAKCKRDSQWRQEEENPCPIANRALLFGVDDPEYPEEWQHVEEGGLKIYAGMPGVTCTAFELEEELKN